METTTHGPGFESSGGVAGRTHRAPTRSLGHLHHTSRTPCEQVPMPSREDGVTSKDEEHFARGRVGGAKKTTRPKRHQAISALVRPSRSDPRSATSGQSRRAEYRRRSRSIGVAIGSLSFLTNRDAEVAPDDTRTHGNRKTGLRAKTTPDRGIFVCAFCRVLPSGRPHHHPAGAGIARSGWVPAIEAGHFTSRATAGRGQPIQKGQPP